MAESRLSPFGFLFGKSLSDLIHGIRRCSSPESRTEFLREAVNECRDEVRSTNLNIKTTAILKLAYLEMLGLDMTWAGFHVVECMASPHFQQKRIGYLAAMQSFRNDAELTMLVTNLLKMDLVSQNTATVSVALSGLATIVSPLLATDVADDIMKMLAHSRPYIRKKAVLALHNVVLQYPEILEEALKRISELLATAQLDYADIDNVSVISAAVSVICELTAHAVSAQSVLELTPKLYTVFQTSQHNWTLIKLLKVFKLFTIREPRLIAKLRPAISEMMVSASATSLVFESAACMVEGNMIGDSDYELAKSVLTEVQQAANVRDANLTHLQVLLLNNLASINPSFVPLHVVTELLSEPFTDPKTRRGVYDLAAKCVSDESLYDLMTELMKQFHAAPETATSLRTDIAETLSEMVAANTYAYVPDFEWLLSVFAEISAVVVPPLLAQRLIDIAVRVQDEEVRQAVSKLSFEWVQANTKDTEDSRAFGDACWWILGEFPPDFMLSTPQNFITELNAHQIQSPASMTCVAKLVIKALAKWAEEKSLSTDLSASILDSATDLLAPLASSPEFTKQGRACEILELFKLVISAPADSMSSLLADLVPLFESYELVPIAPQSQKRILPPSSLDLCTPVTTEWQSDEDFSNSDVSSVASLDVESEPDFTDLSDNYRQPAYEQPVAPEIDEEKLEKQKKEAQLFNLANLETQQRERPLKKKVALAQDATPALASTASTVTDAPKSTGKSVFKMGFAQELLDLSENDPPPVKVKHKKRHK